MGGVALAVGRWGRDPFYQRVLRGRVLDIGGAGDFLGHYRQALPGLGEVIMADKQADPPHCAVDLDDWHPGVAARTMEAFDCVFSSHTLEHVRRPGWCLGAWASAVRPGGYLMVIVPSWETYERRQWPSRSNPDHKTSWVLDNPDRLASAHQWGLLSLTPPGFRLRRAITLDEGFDPMSDRDQTADGTCECGLEAVWQREAA